jgi:hypothetical protein
VKPKPKDFGLFPCFEPISKQPKQIELFRNKPKQTETTLNFLKNILTFKLFGWVFSLFRFNRNIETLCFGKEAKQPKKTVLKQTEKNEKTKKTKKPGKPEIFCKK